MPLRVATYNIRKCLGVDRRRDPRRSLAVIAALGADVVALQEADRRLGQRPAALPAELIEAETDYVALPAAENGISIGWHGNAILVRREMKAGTPRRITLPGLEPRGAVMAELTVPGMQTVTVVAAHLGLRRSDRRAQFGAIGAALEMGRDHSSEVIILGDFNEWSRLRGFEPLAGRFAVYAPGKSFHARRPLAALDRIALSSGLSLADAGVAATPLSLKASDHLPVWADVEAASTR